MIKSFSDKHLKELFETGATAKIDPKLHKRILVKLDRLDAATAISQLNLPGFDFHALKGFDPTRYTIHVNGPWTITFSFIDSHAVSVALEQYH